MYDVGVGDPTTRADRRVDIRSDLESSSEFPLKS